jgi:hypothetical protein
LESYTGICYHNGMTILRHRIVLIIGCILASFIWVRGSSAWKPAAGVDGATLLDAAALGQSIGLAIVLLGVVIVVGMLIAAVTTPVQGALAMAIGLIVPAVRGGTIDEWMRQAESSSAFGMLAIESLLWAVMLGLGAAGIAAGSSKLRKRMRRGKGAGADEPAAGLWGQKVRTEAGLLGGPADRSPVPVHLRGRVNMVLGMVVSVIVGGAAAMLLVRSIDPWQVVWGLGLAFLFAAMIGQQMFPSNNPLGLLVSPLIAGAVWYAYAAVTGGSGQRMLHDYFTGSFVHAALAMPIFYASAGVAGAAAGVLWAQSMNKATEQAKPTSAG